LLEIYNNNLARHRIEITKVSDIAGKPVYGVKSRQTSFSKSSEISAKAKLALVVGCSDYLNGESYKILKMMPIQWTVN
jgi:hypothetical protein